MIVSRLLHCLDTSTVYLYVALFSAACAIRAAFACVVLVPSFTLCHAERDSLAVFILFTATPVCTADVCFFVVEWICGLMEVP